MIKKIKQVLLIVILLLSIPLLATLLFAFFWNIPIFFSGIIKVLGNTVPENIVPNLTISIFWKIYGVFQFLWVIVLLYLLSFQESVEDKK
ncbi:MAG: hypothetical protein MSS16_03870 [Streptococcus orisratti]|uniref:hypothetical protein n=1 Tax=Streptococcus orisratti TaxID=114652 RepID=UPI00235580F4|nr:hypothetical protein [Streptococcus orisratti]MCI7677215.1 hypothetical protein [Streptococcus orisratti]